MARLTLQQRLQEIEAQRALEATRQEQSFQTDRRRGNELRGDEQAFDRENRDLENAFRQLQFEEGNRRSLISEALQRDQFGLQRDQFGLSQGLGEGQLNLQQDQLNLQQDQFGLQQDQFGQQQQRQSAILALLRGKGGGGFGVQGQGQPSGGQSGGGGGGGGFDFSSVTNPLFQQFNEEVLPGLQSRALRFGVPGGSGEQKITNQATQRFGTGVSNALANAKLQVRGQDIQSRNALLSALGG